MHKKVKIILTVAIIIGIAVYFFIQMNKPLKLETQIMQKQSLVRDFKETGKTKTDEQIMITAPYSGKILFIIKEGSKIKKGDLLLQLDSSDLNVKKQELSATKNALLGQEKMSSPTLYQSQLKAIDISIELAQDKVEQLEEDIVKYKDLYENGAIPKSDYDNLNRAYEDALKALSLKKNEKDILIEQSLEKSGTKEFYGNQRQAISVQISDIDNKISQTSVYAKSNGIVTNVYAKKGSFTTNVNPVMDISNLDKIIAVCDVLSSDAIALKIGQKVKILQKIGEDTIEKSGSIIDIGKYAKTKISSLGLEEQRVEIQIQIDDLQNSIIGSDMDIVFETLRIDNIFVLPKSSVFETDESKFVWVINDDKLEIKEITTGKESDYEYEVKSGLNENDIVVLEPNNNELKEGINAVSVN